MSGFPLLEVEQRQFFSPSQYTYTAAIGVDTTIIALFGARTPALLSTQYYPAPSVLNSINPGPYARELFSGGGGAVKVDTALETGILLTLQPGQTIRGLFCKLYTATSTVTDLTVSL